MGGLVPAETLVLYGTAGDNGTASGTVINQAVLNFHFLVRRKKTLCAASSGGKRDVPPDTSRRDGSSELWRSVVWQISSCNARARRSAEPPRNATTVAAALTLVSPPRGGSFEKRGRLLDTRPYSS